MSKPAEALAQVPVAGGTLALTHRPRRSAFAAWKTSGITHVVTLLGEQEGARALGELVGRAGLEWLWVPMLGAAIPGAGSDDWLVRGIDDVARILRAGGHVVVHCSAGIHRTGMFAYALLRRSGLDAAAARERLRELRAVTADGVGDARMAWGDRVADREATGDTGPSR